MGNESKHKERYMSYGEKFQKNEKLHEHLHARLWLILRIYIPDAILKVVES